MTAPRIEAERSDAPTPGTELWRPSLLSTLWTVMRKDFLLEWRGRARINATLFFALLTLLMFSFAVGPDHAMLRRIAPGFLWLAIFLSSVLSLSESMRIERENDALDGLRLIPIDARALFWARP
ncbi:MAG: heme exporter protein CcmB [Myxococcota bacterium]